MDVLVRVDGAVEHPAELTLGDLRSFDSEHQVADVTTLDPKRPGTAVTLSGLLQRVGAHPEADYLGLHSSTDNFHASIPLAAVRDKGVLIYEVEGQPLEMKAGGPARFFIPDHAACRTDEVDECANVKFVDHIELTVGKGYDNRPEDDEEHERLHREQS